MKERDVPGAGRVQYPTGHDIQTEVNYVQLRAGGRPSPRSRLLARSILSWSTAASYPGADYPQAVRTRAARAAQDEVPFGFGNDEIGYLISKAEWDEEPPWLMNSANPWYGEINSVGPDAAGVVLHGLVSFSVVACTIGCAKPKLA